MEPWCGHRVSCPQTPFVQSSKKDIYLPSGPTPSRRTTSGSIRLHPTTRWIPFSWLMQAPHLPRSYRSPSHQGHCMVRSSTFMSNLSTKPHKVICMTDSSGVNGGCQNVYTVYPSPTNQSCTGFTPPASNLGMNAISSATGSTLSRWGWPNSCTDIQLQPIDDKNGGIKGTPPYTLTVVPAYNNPLNITFGMLLFLSVISLTISPSCNPDQSVAWTITLAHSTPFFLSVSDANGVTWTDGPMHAGAGDTSCLTSSTACVALDTHKLGIH